MSTPKIEFVIPSSATHVFVADMFLEDYVGGAELTTEALFHSAPPGVVPFKLHSLSMTDRLVELNKNKHWVLFNWTSVPMDGIVELVNAGCTFSVVEYDYKYCRFRSSHLHKLQTGQDCNCQSENRGRFVSAMYRKAKHVFYMSSGQFNEYRTRLPEFERHKDQMSVLSSVWSPNDLDFILSLKREKPLSDCWAVLKGGSWIKNQQATEQYCKQKGIPYELVGNLPYRDFLKKLSEYKGLVFHPAGFDTCPRLVVEAKLMGLELDLNENVQHQTDEWWNEPSIENYLKTRAEYFWKNV